MKAPITFKFLLPFILLLLPVLVVAEQDIPDLKARVTDVTGTFSKNEIQSLDQKLAAFETKKGSQVVVLVVPSTSPETIEQYGIRVADKWKIGRKKVDDGVLLIVAKNDRKLRIEVAYGLEGFIPDAYAKRIIEQIIVPKFRSGHFYQGINAGTDAIIGLIEGEPLPEPTPEQSVQSLKSISVFFIVIAIVFLFIAKHFFKTPGLLIASLILGLIVWYLISLKFGFIAAIFGFVFASSKGGGSGGRGGVYVGGSHWGGGSSGGFGGGGFSGGGGSFGGGGASGGW